MTKAELEPYFIIWFMGMMTFFALLIVGLCIKHINNNRNH